MSDLKEAILLALRSHMYAPGNYLCKCRECADTFTGDKLAIRCMPCAFKLADLSVLNTGGKGNG